MENKVSDPTSNVDDYLSTLLENRRTRGASSTSNVLAISSGVNGGGNAASPAIPASVNSSSGQIKSPAANVISQTNSQNNDVVSDALNYAGVDSSNSIPTYGSSVSTPLPNTLSPTSFSTGPNESRAAVDVYKETSSKTISAVKEAPAATKPSVTAMAGNKSTTGNLNSILSNTAKAKSSIDSINPLSRINREVPAMFVGMRQLPPNCGTGMTKGVVKDLNGLNKTTMSMNGEKVKVDTSKLACVTGIGNMTNSVSKANGCKTTPFEFSDIGAKLAGLANAIKSATDVGLPGAFKSFICGLTDTFSIDKLGAAVAGTVAAKSDLGSLKSMSESTTKGYLNKTNPTLLKDFAKNYSNKPGSSSADNAGNYQSLTGSFAGIDPNWMKSKRNGSDTTDLTIACQGSPDFKSTMQNGIYANGPTPIANGTADNQDLLYARHLPVTDVNSEVRSSFPRTAVAA